MENTRLQLEKLDLHHYDGKIEHNDAVDNEVERVKSLANEEKLVAFNRLRELVNSKNPACLAAYDTIINDFRNIGRGGSNYDNSNNLYACDLMYICYEIITLKGNNDLLDDLLTQLLDMYSGLCNPGRTTRLYQIVNAYIN